MSIKAIAWAWQQQAKSSHKFVLMAIADSANDFGEAQLSQSFLSWKTELSERVVRDALRALEEAGLMTRVRTTRRDGTRGVDGVVLGLERESTKEAWQGVSEVRRQLNRQLAEHRLPAGEDHGPDVTSGAGEDETPGQSHRQNLPVVDRKSVDNDVSPSGSHRQNLPVVPAYRQISSYLPAESAGSPPSGLLPTTRAPVFYPSSSSVGAARPVDDDDDRSTTDEQPQVSREAEQPPRIHRGVNLSRLRTECASAAGSWPVEVWAGAVDLILDRARSRVGNPRAYVTNSIWRESAVMLDAAEVAGGAADGLGEAAWAVAVESPAGQQAVSEALRPPQSARVRRVSCPVHHTEHLEDQDCGGCRADRLVQCPEEG